MDLSLSSCCIRNSQCVQIVSSSTGNMPLYAKIGCMNRETYTSTKLQLHVYKDAQCSQRYDDGRTAREHATRGYLIGYNTLSTKVSFRPPFYSCMTCAPEEVSANFNKKSVNWYDDDYINNSGKKQNNNNNAQNKNDDNGGNKDDLYDDQYRSANDDVSYGGGRQLMVAESTWADQLEVSCTGLCCFRDVSYTVFVGDAYPCLDRIT
jgi:hypothetical protein